MPEIRIIPMKERHIKEAKRIILDAVFEFQLIPCSSSQDAEEQWKITKELEDLDNLEQVYFSSQGVMLVILDGGVALSG